jgi:hypothetical protein
MGQKFIIDDTYLNYATDIKVSYIKWLVKNIYFYTIKN